MRKQKAILLGHAGLSVEGKKIAKDTGLFWLSLARSDHCGAFSAQWRDRESSLSVSSCALQIHFLQLIKGLERDPAFMQFWEEQVHSAFVYAGDDSEILRKLIRRLTGDNGIVISKINPGVGDLTVSDQLDDFCGVMAGVRAAATKADFDTSLIFNTPKGNLINIISLGHGRYS